MMNHERVHFSGFSHNKPFLSVTYLEVVKAVHDSSGGSSTRVCTLGILNTPTLHPYSDSIRPSWKDPQKRRLGLIFGPSPHTTRTPTLICYRRSYSTDGWADKSRLGLTLRYFRAPALRYTQLYILLWQRFTHPPFLCNSKYQQQQHQEPQ